MRDIDVDQLFPNMNLDFMPPVYPPRHHEAPDDIRFASNMDSLHRLDPYDNSGDPVAGRLLGGYRNWRIGRAMKRNIKIGRTLESLRPYIDHETYKKLAEKIRDIHVVANDRAENLANRMFYVYYGYPNAVDSASKRLLKNVTYHTSVTQGKWGKRPTVLGPSQPTAYLKDQDVEQQMVSESPESALPPAHSQDHVKNQETTLTARSQEQSGPSDEQAQLVSAAYQSGLNNDTGARASPLSWDTTYSDFFPVTYAPPLPEISGDERFNGAPRPEPSSAGSKMFEWTPRLDSPWMAKRADTMALETILPSLLPSQMSASDSKDEPDAV